MVRIVLGIVLVIAIVTVLRVLNRKDDPLWSGTGPDNPVSTSVGDLLAGRVEPGTYVRLQAALVPDALIWVYESDRAPGERECYYVLAVAPGSAFFRTRREALAEIDRFQRDRMPKLGEALEGDEAVESLGLAFNRVVEEVERLCSGHEWAKEAVAIRLADAWRPLGAVEFEDVIREGPRPRLPGLSNEPTFDLEDIPPRYRSQRIADELTLLRWRLQRVTPSRTCDVLARVERTDGLAGRTYRTILGSEPPVYICEERLDQRGLAGTLVATLDVLVTSYPPGASLSVDGAWKGRTPFLLTNVPVKKPVKIDLDLESCWPKTETREFRASVAGVERIEFMLHPK